MKTRRTSWAHGAPYARRILAAALVAALALVAIAGARSVGDAHAATSCTKHTKRVVRHVKRHGKRKRIVRFRHYWTCHHVAAPSTPAPAAPVAPVETAPGPPAVAAPPTTPEPPTSQPEPEANAVSITADDHTNPYQYVPSRSTVRAGRLTVQLDNAGEDEHNMDMQRIGADGEPEGPVVVALSAPRESHSDPTAVEVQPGTYRMWCTIGHHAEHGMQTTITVE